MYNYFLRRALYLRLVPLPLLAFKIFAQPERQILEFKGAPCNNQKFWFHCFVTLSKNSQNGVQYLSSGKNFFHSLFSIFCPGLFMPSISKRNYISMPLPFISSR